MPSDPIKLQYDESNLAQKSNIDTKNGPWFKGVHPFQTIILVELSMLYSLWGCIFFHILSILVTPF